VDVAALGGSDGSDEVDLSVRNPTGGEEVVHRSPKDILEDIARGDAECAKVLKKIKGMLA